MFSRRVGNSLRVLTCSSFLEREDWFYTLSRTASEHARGSAFNSCSGEVNTSSTSRPSLMQTCDRPCVSVQSRDGLKLLLGEKAPTLVPVSQVMMCMNCTADFSLTLRRHHCHGCGRVRVKLQPEPPQKPHRTLMSASFML